MCGTEAMLAASGRVSVTRVGRGGGHGSPSWLGRMLPVLG